METTPIGIVKRKVISSSALEKLKKKKKKKRKGKRSSASSASAGGSPDSTGTIHHFVIIDRVSSCRLMFM